MKSPHPLQSVEGINQLGLPQCACKITYNNTALGLHFSSMSCKSRRRRRCKHMAQHSWGHLLSGTRKDGGSPEFHRYVQIHSTLRKDRNHLCFHCRNHSLSISASAQQSELNGGPTKVSALRDLFLTLVALYINGACKPSTRFPLLGDHHITCHRFLHHSHRFISALTCHPRAEARDAQIKVITTLTAICNSQISSAHHQPNIPRKLTRKPPLPNRLPTPPTILPQRAQQPTTLPLQRQLNLNLRIQQLLQRIRKHRLAHTLGNKLLRLLRRQNARHVPHRMPIARRARRRLGGHVPR